MNKQLKIICLVYIGGVLYCSSISAQNIGIGKSKPTSTLDVNGTLKVDNILIDQSNSPATPILVTNYSDVVDQSVVNVNSVVANIDIAGWQCFTAGMNGVLKNISGVFSNINEPTQKTLTIYEGEGITGNLLATYVWNIPPTNSGQIIIKSPSLDINIIQGEKYTIRLSSFSGWAFTTSELYAGGKSSFGDNLDFGFLTHIFTGSSDIFKVSNEEVSISKLSIGNGSSISKVLNGALPIGQQQLQISTKLVTIVFATPFSDIPKLQAIVQNETSNTNNDYAVTIKSITNTEAIVSIRRLDLFNAGWLENPKLLWWAYE